MSMSDTAGDVLVEPTPVDVLPTPSPPPPPPKAAAAPSPSSLLPSPIFPLSSAAQLLYSDQQRERAETTDDGVSPYLLQRRKFYTDDKWQTLLAQLAATRTLYVGNLSFYTTEAQLFAFFSLCGRPLRLVMGLNERTMTPCGFCFVEFATHEEALNCQRHLSGLMADERVVRADIDPVSAAQPAPASPHSTLPWQCVLMLSLLCFSPLACGQGFEEGRQFGRSKLTGGQVRDAFSACAASPPTLPC